MRDGSCRGGRSPAVLPKIGFQVGQIAEALPQLSEVDVIADGLEPLVHLGHFVPRLLLELVPGNPLIKDGPLENAGEGLGHFVNGRLAAYHVERGWGRICVRQSAACDAIRIPRHRLLPCAALSDGTAHVVTTKLSRWMTSS